MPRPVVRGIAAACTAVLAGALPASAATPSGGSYASAPAVVEAVSCRVDCVDEETVKPGSVVRLTGRDMQRVRTVIFVGGPGDGDDRTARTLRWSRSIADVAVPAGAVTGRVRARSGDGALSRPSVDVLQVGLPAAVALMPGAGADRDTSDRIDARVDASTVYVSGYRKPALRYVVTGDAPLDVAVELVRSADGASVQRWTFPAVAPGVPQRVEWTGLAAPEGRYEFRAFPVAATPAQNGAEPPLVADSFRLLEHKFPVRGPHDFGAEVARFGASRSGHVHQGQDVFAGCGTPLVAARGGVVRWKAFQSRAGNYLVVDGDATDVDYVYMHMQQPAIVERGQRVLTGQRIGNVGDTGDARGCHLHFELWSAPGWYEGGKPFDPLTLLQAWDGQSGLVSR